MLATKLSCWIGRHTWTTQVEQGESYKVCSVCGKSELPANGGLVGTTGDRPAMHDIGPADS